MGLETTLRTATCGELTAANVGQQVTLTGWVNRRRDHGKLIFLDLRDRYGVTQIIFDPNVALARAKPMPLPSRCARSMCCGCKGR